MHGAGAFSERWNVNFLKRLGLSENTHLCCSRSPKLLPGTAKPGPGDAAPLSLQGAWDRSAPLASSCHISKNLLFSASAVLLCVFS